MDGTQRTDSTQQQTTISSKFASSIKQFFLAIPQVFARVCNKIFGTSLHSRIAESTVQKQTKQEQTTTEQAQTTTDQVMTAFKSITKEELSRELYESVSLQRKQGPKSSTVYFNNNAIHKDLAEVDALTTAKLKGVENVFAIFKDHQGAKDIIRNDFSITIGDETLSINDTKYAGKNTQEKLEAFGTDLMTKLRKFAKNEKNRNGKAEDEFLLDCVKGVCKFFGQSTQGSLMLILCGKTGHGMDKVQYPDFGIKSSIEFGDSSITYKVSDTSGAKDPNGEYLQLCIEETSKSELQYGASGFPQLVADGTGAKLFNATITKDGKIGSIGALISEIKISPEDIQNAKFASMLSRLTYIANNIIALSYEKDGKTINVQQRVEELKKQLQSVTAISDDDIGKIEQGIIELETMFLKTQ